MGVAALLRSLSVVLGLLGVAALLLGASRASWWVVGLAATVQALQLWRVATAARHPLHSEERSSGDAALLEPWIGLIAVLGGLWGLLSPPSPADAAPWWLLGLLGLIGGVALVGGRYATDTPDLPEGPALGRWSRATAWAVGIVLLEYLFVAAAWPQQWAVDAVAKGLLGLFLVVGVQLFAGSWTGSRPSSTLRGVDPAVMRWGFARWNPVASIGQAIQDSLGVDLRTTWAIQFLRRAVQPMAVGVLALGWLCTGFVQVHPEEVAIHERLGRPLSREPLGPGLHVVAPWPVDRLRRVPVKRVAMMTIGAEHGEEDDEDEAEGHEGPEDTLWAKMHAEEEYTLLLGDGRDLVTLDGLLHYQVSDPYTYLYACQNPEEGLRAAVYEALTARTAGRSLDAVLSENLSAFADQVVDDVLKRAEELELGLRPVSFTLKGLHPPFAVAKDYQAVVSAQIAQRTSVIRAAAYRNGLVPAAQAEAQAEVDDARAAALRSRAESVGESEAFGALLESYAESPTLFRFRRRMETLEVNLEARQLTILDRRFEAQGGELWMLK